MNRIRADFDHGGIHYSLFIEKLIRHEATPTSFQVFDTRNYYAGALIYYPRQKEWAFYSSNDKNPDIAGKLGDYAAKNFPVPL